MRKSNHLLSAISATAILGMIGITTPANAGLGDAVVGGVVGGVVGSVITNAMYHGHHRHYRRVHHRRHVQRTETDEMKIQRALKSLGFYRGPIDGQINSFETRTAIKELNRAYEIGDTAYMSPQERDALIYLGNLLEFDRNLIAQGTDRRTKVRRIQTALKILGFYPGKIDGASGPGTRNAIAQYKSAYGLTPGYSLNYEEEYRLIDTAKKQNDKNIQETLASLKRLGAQGGMRPAQMPAPGQKPVILQPAAQPQAPIQGTIMQQAPAPHSAPMQNSMAPRQSTAPAAPTSALPAGAASAQPGAQGQAPQNR
ncbi:peptidoglycan-binding protein [Nitratifractor sp.]